MRKKGLPKYPKYKRDSGHKREEKENFLRVGDYISCQRLRLASNSESSENEVKHCQECMRVAIFLLLAEDRRVRMTRR